MSYTHDINDLVNKYASPPNRPASPGRNVDDLINRYASKSYNNRAKDDSNDPPAQSPRRFETPRFNVQRQQSPQRNVAGSPGYYYGAGTPYVNRARSPNGWGNLPPPAGYVQYPPNPSQYYQPYPSNGQNQQQNNHSHAPNNNNHQNVAQQHHQNAPQQHHQNAPQQHQQHQNAPHQQHQNAQHQQHQNAPQQQQQQQQQTAPMYPGFYPGYPTSPSAFYGYNNAPNYNSNNNGFYHPHPFGRPGSRTRPDLEPRRIYDYPRYEEGPNPVDQFYRRSRRRSFFEDFDRTDVPGSEFVRRRSFYGREGPATPGYPVAAQAPVAAPGGPYNTNQVSAASNYQHPYAHYYPEYPTAPFRPPSRPVSPGPGIAAPPTAGMVAPPTAAIRAPIGDPLYHDYYPRGHAEPYPSRYADPRQADYYRGGPADYYRNSRGGGQQYDPYYRDYAPPLTRRGDGPQFYSGGGSSGMGGGYPSASASAAASHYDQPSGFDSYLRQRRRSFMDRPIRTPSLLLELNDLDDRHSYLGDRARRALSRPVVESDYDPIIDRAVRQSRHSWRERARWSPRAARDLEDFDRYYNVSSGRASLPSSSSDHHKDHHKPSSSSDHHKDHHKSSSSSSRDKPSSSSSSTKPSSSSSSSKPSSSSTKDGSRERDRKK